MIQEVNKKLVLIHPKEPESGLLETTQLTMEEARKRINQGTVLMVGSEVTWPATGDVVSFYRAAATELTDEDGTELLIMNEGHILVKY